jgi:glycosyltransferase involved in cell wall biosynthesis
VAEFLLGRGHEVEVVTTAERTPAIERYPVRWTPRSLPRGVRHLHAAGLVAAAARRAEVVYTTGMLGRTTLGALLARRPTVIKLTADPAFERARRGGLATDLGGFARVGGLRPRVLRAARDVELRRAAHVFCPSGWLRDLVVSWGVPAERVDVLPNPAPDVAGVPGREEARRALGLERPTLVFAGRLTAQKALPVALRAVAAVDGVDLVVAGDGPERAAVEQEARDLGLNGRVRFVGPLPRAGVLETLRAADAAVLSSSWENFPHAVVEALAVGTPVLGTDVGGVAEVVTDGENGLLVPVGDDAALAAAIERYLGDEPLRERLRAAAAPSVAAYARDALYDRLERVLLAAA